MVSAVWVAFDVETTGFLPDGQLIEIGAVLFRKDGLVEGEFQEFIRPSHELPEFISDLTGITTAMVKDARAACDVVDQFLDWVPPDATLVAHNISFDIAMLARATEDSSDVAQWSCVDSLEIARALGEFPDNRLKTIADILGCDHGNCHRALSDAHVVREFMLHAFSRSLAMRRPTLFRGTPASTFLRAS